MRIVLNGELREVEAVRLSDLLNELGFGQAKVATAVNEAFVPAPGAATSS
jgi:sulfur carrier protein